MKSSISKINPKITLKFLTTEKENQYFDRKSARIDTKEVARHISAFANASGGTLVIGVEDKGSLTGFTDVGSSKVDKFKRVPFDFLKSTPIIKTEVIDITNTKLKDDILLIYHIEPSVKRVIRTTSDDVYLRIGDQSRRLTHDEITNLEYDKGERHIEEELVERSSIADIDTKLLGEYKNIIKTNLSDKEVLEARGLLIDNKLTLAGILLFSKSPLKYYPNSRLRFLRYEGTEAKTGERINLTKDINIDGPIPKIIEESKNIISAHLRDFQTLASDGKFKIVPEYPEFAWFEGIVNALTHRDYSQRGEHIKVIMYDDRLEILSPGKLPNIVDINNMRYTRYSRNPIIARVLSEFGWVKELNEGVKRIYDEMENYFLKPPEYSEPNRNSVLLKLENNYIMRQIRGNEHMQKVLTEELWENLSVEEKDIIHYLYKEGKITTGKALEVLGRSAGYSRKLLNRLKELEILSWIGSSPQDPTQYYELNIDNSK